MYKFTENLNKVNKIITIGGRYVEEAKLRHELKYYINYSDYLAIRSRLCVVARKDAHVGPSGTYLIRSIYFDNYNDKALREKIDGVNLREKFRIRYYNKDTSRIMLEKKSKICGKCKKQKAFLSKEQCQAIVDGNAESLKESKDPLLIELYSKMTMQQMRPRVIVDYEREAYIYPQGNVRITFDTNIKTGLYSKDFLNPEVPMIAAGDNQTMILEVKYDEYLPEIIQMAIQMGNRSQSAFSKYAACRIYG